jgi:hypothetical protein
MSVFESTFGNQALSVKDPTHAIQCSPLIVLYFERERKKLTHCKIKMAFPMVLCIHFKLKFWVYLLIVCDEVTFYEFQEKQGTQVKT